MSGGRDIGFSCTCGQISGLIKDASPKTVVRARCFCADCRAAELYHHQPDPGDGGVDLTMVDPAALRFDRGVEHLAAIKIYPKGILRWYAVCCGARLFNTLDTPRFAFVTVCTDRIAEPDALGPEQARAFVPTEDGKTRHEHASRLYLPMMRRSLVRFFTGGWRKNPLYDAKAGRMRVTPHILTREERAAIGLISKTSAT
ncbi:DUF6151 family protein [Aestuariivita boseongensis]|uniref:DUF6151 family protein n=1 Tax=Aestuariivita boseongensis TaxID=1470562 RepID=UPI000682C4C4|nr:DUF6151 family protein [Aestuariivita boseongensis]